ncbi:hypothetical protein [Microviridae sp.]|jgi:hypothetical protein|nr:hypothetical protein [Microviridae sp.]
MKKSTNKTKKQFSNPRLRKQFQTTPLQFKGEINDQPSLTVPDLTLTIKQLLVNHSRGIQSDVSHNEPMYFDTEIPIIDDITDLDAFRQDLKAREKALSLKIKQENDKHLADQAKKLQDHQNALKEETEKQTLEKNENL